MPAMVSRSGARAASLAVALTLCCAPILVGPSPAGATAVYDPEAVGTGEGTNLPGGVGVAPGAIEPQPVNPVIEAEFEANLAEWTQRGKLAVAAPEADATLTPGLEGGWVGWCLTIRVGAHHATRCPVAPRLDGIGYESWEAGGSGTLGVALTSSSLEGVAVNEASTAEPTVPVEGVAGVSAALVEIPEPFPARSKWFDAFAAVVHGIRSSDQRGLIGPEEDYSASLPASEWRAPQQPAPGECSLRVAHLAGMIPRFGHVVANVTPTRGIAGDGFASCIDAEYSYAGSSLDAAVLLDAGQPGLVAPVRLPGATRVPHHPGLFSAAGWNGQILGRRIANAWLLVEGGASLRQRIRVLSHLRASVRL
jgi:hypothetical protein